MRQNRRQLFLIADTADRQRLAIPSGAACPADAVDIGFDHFRKVVIDHEAKP